jgi:hypothetical protein
MRSDTHWGRPESEFCMGSRPSEFFIATPLKYRIKNGRTVKFCRYVQRNNIYLNIFKSLVFALIEECAE